VSVNKIDEIKNELVLLIKEANQIIIRHRKNQVEGLDKTKYDIWYSKALPVVQQLIPERYEEFTECYRLKKAVKRQDLNHSTYTINDYFIGMIFVGGDYLEVAYRKFMTQLGILAGALSRLDSILKDIKGVLQANLFDNELDAADHLLKNGHLRAAGAVAGVVLEEHVKAICTTHSIQIRKKKPTISDFNDKLKSEQIYDIVQWRKIQHLGDIRNLCDHKKRRDPKPEEVEELIEGVKTFIKTIF